MADNSFLRLKPSFAEAKRINDPNQSQLRYYDCIQLHPQEHYLQITNSSVDIAFDNNYSAFIVDGDDVELLNITGKTTISQFIDQNGIRQIAFEVVNIGQSWYGQPVYLRLKQTDGDDTFWSNPFTVSDENTEETFLLNYGCYSEFEGTDYENAPFAQSVRLKGIFTQLNDETENSQYRQTTGKVVSKRSTIVFSENWKLELINNFTFRALSVAVKSDFYYVNLKRCTDLPALKSGEVIGNSNVSNAEITFFPSEELYDDVYQLTDVFEAITFYPFGSINQDVVNIAVPTITFNKEVSATVDASFLLYKENGEFVATIGDLAKDSVNNIKAGSNQISDYLPDYGNYYILLDGIIYSDIGESYTLTDPATWVFTFSEGDWLSTDFLSTDWLID